MRLIDADALIEAFKVKSGIWTETSKYLIGVIENQPTAYDVEKVVAELEEAISHFQDNGDMRYGLQIAIDIVKRGGVE